MWRRDFDFHPDITLTPKSKHNHKVFYDRDEFFEFLKSHGVRLDDASNPLMIEDDANASYIRKIPGLQSVVQWSLIGWIKDDYK